MKTEETVGYFPLLLDKNCVRPNVEYLEEINSTYTPTRVFSTNPKADRRTNRALATSFQSSRLEDYYENKTLREIHVGLQRPGVPLPLFVTTLDNLRDNAVCREVATVVFESLLGFDLLRRTFRKDCSGSFRKRRSLGWEIPFDGFALIR